MEIYHGSTVIVETPEIRIEKFNKDFYFGFYCTVMEDQAIRWATRFGDGIVNVFEYVPNDSLKILKFEKMTEEWLDFIIACRSGTPHDWDIVEGPMADDTIYNYIQEFQDGKISREAFWTLAKFRYPTHQISFNTKKALETIKFKEARKVYG
ncbi:MAG: DUF3990 domain-containing protein [Methanobrevibacter sp.]|uniref:DUF3990 domain-containing protein n=1 Tax=Methanobrevibacter sp. TaxID=66852 RepID=UPI0025E0B3F6|nr:DUF3990 domain-containing protein [Methanobrevibacter sp.]MBR0270585.1 DUF3990 domain-containing protein [Methanobrevibacter sp.]